MFTCTLAQYVAYKTNVAQQFTPQKHYRLPHPDQGILGPALAIYASQPSAFSTMPLQDPTWHMDTGASSHLNFNDYLTRHILLRCDSSSDLYPVTKPSTSPIAFLSTSASTWHQRLGHPGDQHKFHADGTLSRYKARLVANGSNQQHGVDFDETFSQVVKPTTIRTILSLVVSRQWPIHQLDVNNAFLNGDLSETMYMHQPPSFVDTYYPNHVCLLQRSLYGLKQAPRAWFQRFAGYATRASFSPSRHDSSLFIYIQGSQIVNSLHKEFDMTNLEALNYFLGISAIRHPTGLFLSQKNSTGHPEACLQLYAFATTSLVGYIDADWAGCPSTRRSTSSYCMFLGDNLLSWSAKRQHTISCSSAKAEYQGVANVVTETAWIRNLLCELHSPLLTATLVYCDNVSAVYMSANPVQHQCTKHIKIDIHFVCDMVKVGHVRVLHVPSRFQYADIFTKGLPSALFEDFSSSLSVRPPPSLTTGAY
ncbi:ribonuclease H-like domain-containing protein [Tanacetum coccineum]